MNFYRKEVIKEVGDLFVISSNTSEYIGSDGVTKVPTKVMFDFICRPVGGELAVSDETSGSGWFTAEEAKSMITQEAMKERFRAFIEYDGRVRLLEYHTRLRYELKLDRFISGSIGR